jgi:hypothetical protein
MHVTMRCERDIAHVSPWQSTKVVDIFSQWSTSSLRPRIECAELWDYEQSCCAWDEKSSTLLGPYMAAIPLLNMTTQYNGLFPTSNRSVMLKHNSKNFFYFDIFDLQSPLQ